MTHKHNISIVRNMTYNDDNDTTRSSNTSEKLNSLVLILCDLIAQQEADSSKHEKVWPNRIIQRKRIIRDLTRDIKQLQNKNLDIYLKPKNK